MFIYFALEAGDSGFLSATSAHNTVEVAAQIGIIAAPITLLLVAGEFDLSVGSVVGASQILLAYPLVEEGWPLWAAIVFTLVVCAGIGALNGLGCRVGMGEQVLDGVLHRRILWPRGRDRLR